MGFACVLLSELCLRWVTARHPSPKTHGRPRLSGPGGDFVVALGQRVAAST